MAVKAGLPRCRPVLLEPIMKMEISTPEESLGDILGSLNQRRAQITGVEQRAGLQIINYLDFDQGTQPPRLILELVGKILLRTEVEQKISVQRQ